MERAILFSISSISLYCQTEFIMGERTKTPKKINSPEFFEKTDSGDYITITLNKKSGSLAFKQTPFLSHYGENLNLIKEVTSSCIK